MISHFGFDTLPRVVPSTAPDLVDLVVPFRLDAEQATRPLSWTLHAEVDGVSRATDSRVITREFIDDLRQRVRQGGMFDFEQLPFYLDMESSVDAATYVEARVLRLTPGDLVRYRLDVTVAQPAGRTTVVPSDDFSTYAVRPGFGRDDIRCVHAANALRPQDAWVLYHRADGGLHHLRIDVAALKDEHGNACGGTAGGLVDLVVTIGGTTTDLNQTHLDVLPIVDPAADSVVFTVASDATPDEVTVRYHGLPAVPVKLGATTAARLGSCSSTSPSRASTITWPHPTAVTPATHLHPGHHARRRGHVQQPTRQSRERDR